MLVVTRRTNEETVIEIPPSSKTRTMRLRIIRAAGTVRLGFDAPRDIEIVRDNAKKGRAA